jgi:hypothetical protein
MTTFALIPPRGDLISVRAEGASTTCNIGPGELRRRRDAALAAAAALGAALLAIVAGLLPPWTTPYLAPLAGAVVITYLQFRMRFCAGFGIAGMVGMGEQPGAVRVDPALRAAHRRRAALMIAAAAGASLAWAVATGWLVLHLG